MSLLAKEVHRVRDQLAEREEEIIELKAERNNTRVSDLSFVKPYIYVGVGACVCEYMLITDWDYAIVHCPKDTFCNTSIVLSAI